LVTQIYGEKLIYISLFQIKKSLWQRFNPQAHLRRNQRLRDQVLLLRQSVLALRHLKIMLNEMSGKEDEKTDA
jgi:hypothetical protein